MRCDIMKKLDGTLAVTKVILSQVLRGAGGTVRSVGHVSQRVKEGKVRYIITCT